MSFTGHAHDLFLSYAHAEAQWVEAFKKAFCQEFVEREGRPISIWQDSTDVRPGTKWTAELEGGVKGALTKAVTAIRVLFRSMSNGKTNVYLASGAIEMEPHRSQFENELTGRNYKVRPSFALDESFGPKTLVSEMEPCSRAIFLLGGAYDKFVETQIDQAITLNKPCLFWIHPRLSINPRTPLRPSQRLPHLRRHANWPNRQAAQSSKRPILHDPQPRSNPNPRARRSPVPHRAHPIPLLLLHTVRSEPKDRGSVSWLRSRP